MAGLDLDSPEADSRCCWRGEGKEKRGKERERGEERGERERGRGIGREDSERGERRGRGRRDFSANTQSSTQVSKVHSTFCISEKFTF